MSFLYNFWWIFCVVMSMMMLMFVDEFLDVIGFSMKFDEDVLKLMKKRKWRKKMKFSMNFWVWSMCNFFFVPLTLWLNIWNDTSASSATSNVASSSSVCHIDVFVTDDDDKNQNQNQNVYNLEELLSQRKRYWD